MKASEIDCLNIKRLEIITKLFGVKLVDVYCKENYLIYLEFENGTILKFSPDSIDGIEVQELTKEQVKLGY